MSDAPPRAEECAGLAHQVTRRYGRILVLLMTVALAALVAPAGALTWTTTTVDSTGSAGYYTSLAITSGNPSISYYDATNSDLKYVRATDADGTAWGTPVTVDSTGLTGWYTSLAITNGNPSISYYDATNSYLKYVRATDASGTAWGTPVTVDSTGYTGQYTSLAITNGNPSISYYDYANGDLKYVRATDASGTAWGTPVTVDSTGSAGEYTSLAITNGNPSISYYDYTNGDLKYVRATDASGTAWGTPVTVDSTGTTGMYTSLAITNGNPSISYYDNTNGDLKYVRATDASGTAWGTPEIVDSTGSAGLFTSLAITNGNPSIGYYDATNADLKYARGGTVAPVSSFTASPVSGDAPLTVTFTDTSTNIPDSWNWNFGSWSAADGGLSTQLNPVHTYDSPGTYVVTLTVLNAVGGDTNSQIITVTDPDPHLPPVSSFTASPVSGDAPLTVTFTDTSSNAPDSWNWNFGSWSAADGGISTQLNPVHTYDSPGTCVVTLTVLNAVGGDTSSQTITVASSGTAQVTVLEADPVQPATVYAGLDGQGVYRSPDSGSSWSHLTLPTGANLRIRALAPVRLAGSPATTLYAGSYGGGVYRSTDGGATWGTCSALPDQYVLSLVANSTAGVYAGTESGVYASTDGCSSWIAVNNGLP